MSNARQGKDSLLKNAAIIVSMLLSAVLFAGCSTVESDATEVAPSPERKKIKVKVDPDRSVRITNAMVRQENDTVRVSGTLRPRSTTSRMAGHIHVSFLGTDGGTIRHLLVEPNTKAFFRRSIIIPRFNVSVAMDSSEVSEVLLKHHAAPIEDCSYGIGTANESGS